MALQTAMLALVLLTNLSSDAHMTNLSDGVLNQENADAQSPKLKCIISTNNASWRLGNEGAEISVDVQVQGTAELSVMPSVHLIALPKKRDLEQSEYWAPFAVPTGASTKEKQKLSAATGSRSV